MRKNESETMSISRRIARAILVIAIALLAGLAAAPVSKAEAATQWKKVDGYPSGYTNGTVTFVVDNQAIYKITNSTGARKKIVSLSQYYKNDIYCPVKVTYVYGKNIYFSWVDSEFHWRTTSYNYKTKKFTTRSKKYSIVLGYDDYVVANTRIHQDVSHEVYTVFKLSSTGKMTAVKKLTNYGFGATLVGKHIYFMKYTDSMMSVGTLVRCTYKGTSGKKLGTFLASQPYSQVLLMTPTKTSCGIMMDGNNYTYDYASKTLY